jgi:hypothetical protein
MMTIAHTYKLKFLDSNVKFSITVSSDPLGVVAKFMFDLRVGIKITKHLKLNQVNDL